MPLAVGIVHPLDTVRTTMQAAVACQKFDLLSSVIKCHLRSYRQQRPKMEVLCDNKNNSNNSNTINDTNSRATAITTTTTTTTNNNNHHHHNNNMVDC